jgi:hypothetical protein
MSEPSANHRRIGFERRYPPDSQAMILTCGKCGSEWACRYKLKRLPVDAILNKARQAGWDARTNGKHTCKECQMEVKSPSETGPREMQPQDRRRVFRAVEEVYDEANGRYMASQTDHTVALALGVPRAWVEAIREENFGPSGHSLAMEQVETEIRKAISEMKAVADTLMAGAAQAERKIAELQGLAEKVHAIREAVGPRAKRP